MQEVQLVVLAQGSDGAAVHCDTSHCHSLDAHVPRPIAGPVVLPDMHVREARHHPQPPTGVQVPHVVLAAHGSPVTIAQSPVTHAQRVQVPLLGPVAVPAVHRPVS